MKLTALKVAHFRCLYDTDWIPFSPLSIFTGENDGGKSTTLLALEVFLDAKRSPGADDYSFALRSAGDVSTSIRETAITIQGRFDLLDTEVTRLNEVWGTSSRTIVVKREFQVELASAPYLFIAEAYDDDAFRQPLDKYTIPQLKEIAGRLSIGISTSRTKAEIIGSIRLWLTTQPKVLSEVELPDDLISHLPEVQVFSSESALDPENEIRRTLTTQFRDLIKTDKYSGAISQMERDVEVDLNNELDKLAPFVKQYSGDVEKVSIRPRFNFASGLATTALQLLRSDGRPILLQQSGAGQRRRLSLAVYEWSQELFKNRDDTSRQLIMAFDEPDTHLDYRAQRAIFDVIKRFAELPAMQVVVCTHSLNLIDRVPIDRIVFYRLDGAFRHTIVEVLSVADHETTDLFMFEISKNMGLKNSVMLHERCFLAIEGTTEAAVLPVLFHKKYGMPLQSAGICLVNGEGNYGARMLMKFLNANKRQVIFMIDSDARTTTGSRKLFTPASFAADRIDEATQVHYVGRQELEDAFADTLWARMAEAEYPKASGLPWDASEFAGLRSAVKFSKAVQNKIRADAGLNYDPAKPDLGYKLASHATVAEIPAQITRCLEEAYRLANL